MIKGALVKASDEAMAMAVAKQKIEVCRANLLAWGSSNTHRDTEEIKRLQKKIEVLNSTNYTEGNKVEFLETSKKLDEVLRRQEIY